MRAFFLALSLSIPLASFAPNTAFTSEVRIPLKAYTHHLQDIPRTHLRYIEKYAGLAVRLQHRYNIPAAVTLAQGILESGGATSYLGRHHNNHFGVRYFPNTYYQGDYYTASNGRTWRSYTSAAEGFEDRGLFFMETKLGKRYPYRSLLEHNPNDYATWCRELQRRGYATYNRYAKALIERIERYELDQVYDNYLYVDALNT